MCKRKGGGGVKGFLNNVKKKLQNGILGHPLVGLLLQLFISGKASKKLVKFRKMF